MVVRATPKLAFLQVVAIAGDVVVGVLCRVVGEVHVGDVELPLEFRVVLVQIQCELVGSLVRGRVGQIAIKL